MDTLYTLFVSLLSAINDYYYYIIILDVQESKIGDVWTR